MKVLQINATYGYGSTGTIVRDISDGLIATGNESCVMWATRCRSNGQNVMLIRVGNTVDHKFHAIFRRIDGGQGMHSRLATVSACKKINKLSPDVVHLHNLHSNYIHVPTLMKHLAYRNIPTLITLHDCWFLTGHCMHYAKHQCEMWTIDCGNCPAVPKRLRKAVKKRFEQRKRIISDFKSLSVNGVSHWTAFAAGKSILSGAENIECIYNWVDTELFSPKKSFDNIREKYRISDDKKIVIGVAQAWDMSDNKGIDAFIDLADRLSESTEIILVGKDNGVVKKNNLKCIGYVGEATELAELYSRADVLLNASCVETFGLVTAEAMSCGTPVVAYKNTGTAEILGDKCGILVEDGNKEALIDSVINILNNGKEKYSAECRDHVIKNFEKKSQIQKYIELYTKISSSS